MRRKLTDRQRVWVAMSDMFLDSDIADMIEGPARVLADSPFEMDVLDAILIDEVYPVCAYNLRSVAGIWTGFDPDELIAVIETHIARRYPLLRLWLPFRRRLMRGMLPQWPALRARVVALRAGAPDGIPK